MSATTIPAIRAGISPIAYGYQPNEGTRSLWSQYNWSLQTSYYDDLARVVAAGMETTVQSVVVDNSTNSQSITITGHNAPGMICPAYSQGIFPWLATPGGRFRISTSSPVNAVTRVQFVNFPLPLGTWSASGGAPSLDLNFVAEGLSGGLDSRIAFARSSVGTYFDNTGTMQTAAANIPRFDYGSVTPGAAPLGLLIEQAVTNLNLWSNDFSNAVWIDFNGTTAVGNTTKSPDGTLNASTINVAAGGGLYQPLTVGAGVTVTFSVWLRAAAPNSQIDVVINTNLSDAVATVCNITTQWQRFSVTKLTQAGTTSISVQIQSFTSGGTVFAFGAQTEVGPAPTSTIYTTTAAVTRAADVATMPTAPWFNTAHSNSTLAVDAVLEGINPATQFSLAQIDDGTASNRLTLRDTNGTAQVFGLVFAAGSLTANAVAGTVTPGTLFKAGFSINNGVQLTAFNGVAGANAGGATPVASGMTTLRIGTQEANAAQTNGWIARLRYWPRTLAQSELNQVTV